MVTHTFTLLLRIALIAAPWIIVPLFYSDWLVPSAQLPAGSILIEPAMDPGPVDVPSSADVDRSPINGQGATSARPALKAHADPIVQSGPGLPIARSGL